ncbi:flagellar hook protein FlgE [Teichococcus aestuarii]|nr:flagellar hook protein FlgE [Pseudoroseomonas aestuarii]
MSLFGSMTTAISGMNAQARALGHISDNVANSQTIGFKRTDTSFANLLTQSNERTHAPSAVVATPSATVSLQGSVETVENPLSLALSGNGLFSVAQAAGRNADGSLTFDTQPLFTRAGDFRKDSSGYLVNGSGYALQGWAANAAGEAQQGVLAPVRISDAPLPATATRTVTLNASLPKGAAAPIQSQVQIYNAAGEQQTVNLTWTRTADNAWNVAGTTAEGAALGEANLAFDANTGALTNNPPQAVLGAGDAALTLNLANLAQGPVAAYEQRSVTVDGSRAGAFRSASIRDNGDVVVSYDNGQSRTVAKVPVVTFTNPDALQRMDGQAFGMTAEAGTMQVQAAGTQGAGTLSSSAVERSNVDIAAEFSKLVVAQRAYTANTRVVTTSDEMLNETINMRR